MVLFEFALFDQLAQDVAALEVHSGLDVNGVVFEGVDGHFYLDHATG